MKQQHPWLRLALLALAWLLALPALAATPAPGAPPTVSLAAAQGAVEPASLMAWSDASGQASIEQVAALAAHAFEPSPAGRPRRLQPGTALWIHLRLQRSAGAPADWVLELPMPLVDRVTLYRPAEHGAAWRAESAGDEVPMALWPEPGRYPAFALTVPTTHALDLYLRIQHDSPLALPLRLVPAQAHAQSVQREYMVLGLTFGALALLVLSGLWQAWKLRDGSYAWFAAYGAAATSWAAAYTGAAGHLLWGNAPEWSDLAPGCLALVAASLALRMVWQLTATTARQRLLFAPIRTAVWLGPALALAYAFIEDRRYGMVAVGIYMLTVSSLGMLAAASTWRRDDPVGRWLLAGVFPIALALLLAMARLYGQVEASWLTTFGPVAAIAWTLPMLRAALNRRSSARRSAQLRQQALASHDPLTGLPKVGPFRARLRKTLLRHAQTREPASLVVIEVVNLPAIAASRGAEAAEECLLRSVIKLQRLVRDVDMIGRLGENCFGVVLDGMASRAAVNEFASHLIASGLIQDPDHPRDPLLQFHVAVALLRELPRPGITIMEELLQLLATMSPRTRRPIRYLQPPGQDSTPPSEYSQLPSALRSDRIPEVI